MSDVRRTRARFGVFRPVPEQPTEPCRVIRPLEQMVKGASTVCHVVDKDFLANEGYGILTMCNVSVEAPNSVFEANPDDVMCCVRCKKMLDDLRDADDQAEVRGEASHEPEV